MRVLPPELAAHDFVRHGGETLEEMIKEVLCDE